MFNASEISSDLALLFIVFLHLLHIVAEVDLGALELHDQHLPLLQSTSHLG